MYTTICTFTRDDLFSSVVISDFVVRHYVRLFIRYACEAIATPVQPNLLTEMIHDGKPTTTASLLVGDDG